jgi:hypothetical protein
LKGEVVADFVDNEGAAVSEINSYEREKKRIPRSWNCG